MCKLMKCRIILALDKYTVICSVCAEPHTVCAKPDLSKLTICALELLVYASLCEQSVAKCCSASEVIQVWPPYQTL